MPIDAVTVSGAARASAPPRDAARVAWLGVAVYAGWCLRDFLQDGLPVGFDAHSHLARVSFAARAFAAGHYPGWVNDWYGGFRPLEFYGPAWYWLAAAVGLALRDVVLAVKLVVWAAQVASAVLLFAFTKRVTGRTLPAVLAAVLFIYSAERGFVIGTIGNFPTTLLYLTVPALLSLAWGIAAGPLASRRLFAAQSLLVGAMLAAHFANGLLLLPAILAFEAVRIAQVIPGSRDRLRVVAAAAGSIAAAAVLLAFTLVPALLDLDRVSLSLDFGNPSSWEIRAESMLVAAGILPAGLDHLYMRDHGALWIVLGLLAGLASLGRKHGYCLPLFVGLCTNLVTVMVVSERAAIGLAFFLYPLCAVALDTVSRWFESVGLARARYLLPAAGIAIAIGFPADVPPLRYEPESNFAVYRALPESATRSRTFDVTPTTIALDGFYGASSFSPHFSARGIPFGAYPQGSPLAAQVRLALWGLLADDLARVPAKVSEDSLDLLYLDHVEFVVARPTLPPGTRRAFPVAAADPGWRTMLQLPHASPAVFAPELAWLPESLEETGARDLPPRLLGVLERRWRNDPSDSATMGSLDPLFRIRTGRDWEVLVPYLRGMQLDRTRARAERIFVDTRLPPGTSVSTDPGDFAVLSHDEEPTRVRIVARASRDGFVRLSYSYDPDAIVALDGAPIEAVADSLGGAITLAFPEGTHVVEVGAPPPNLQKGLLWLSGFLALVLMTVLVRSGQRRDAANGGTMDSLPAIPSVRF